MSKNKYYAVVRGRKPGIYHSWEECNAQVHQFPNEQYKSFSTYQEAELFMEENKDEHKIETKKTSNQKTNLSLNTKRIEKHYYKEVKYSDVGADETGKEVFGPMIACVVYYKDKINDLIDLEIEINEKQRKKVTVIDSKKFKSHHELGMVADKLKAMDDILDYELIYFGWEEDLKNNKYNYNRIYKTLNNKNKVQALLLNQGFHTITSRNPNIDYITYDAFDTDENYYKYLSDDDLILSAIPTTKVIKNIIATKEADSVRYSPSAAASIIASDARNKWFEKINKERPIYISEEKYNELKNKQEKLKLQKKNYSFQVIKSDTTDNYQFLMPMGESVATDDFGILYAHKYGLDELKKVMKIEKIEKGSRSKRFIDKLKEEGFDIDYLLSENY